MLEEQRLESGWPARDFDPEARSFLLQEARQRVQEQLAQVRNYDVKIAALFTASAGLFALSGFLGSLKLEASPAALLTMMAVSASLVAWILMGFAYWLRETGTGLEMQVIRESYAGISRQELEDAALESHVEDFILNERTIRAKARWLTRSLFAVAAQLVLLFAATIASSYGSRRTQRTETTAMAERTAMRHSYRWFAEGDGDVAAWLSSRTSHCRPSLSRQRCLYGPLQSPS